MQTINCVLQNKDNIKHCNNYTITIYNIIMHTRKSFDILLLFRLLKMFKCLDRSGGTLQNPGPCNSAQKYQWLFSKGNVESMLTLASAHNRNTFTSEPTCSLHHTLVLKWQNWFGYSSFDLLQPFVPFAKCISFQKIGPFVSPCSGLKYDCLKHASVFSTGPSLLDLRTVT